jgi:hypothetical protein
MEDIQQSSDEQLVKEISSPLFKSKGWVKLLGILMLIYGVLMALSIVGLIVAWLPIWIGILLMQVSNRINEAMITGSRESLVKAQASLSTYFTVYGALALVGLIVSAITIIVVMSTGMLTHLEQFRPDYY